MIGYGASGTTHDFFAYNSSGSVWNGAAYVTWADGDFADYRITATEVGTTGRFTGTTPASTVSYELRERGATLALSYITWTDVTTLDTIQARTDLIGTSASQLTTEVNASQYVRVGSTQSVSVVCNQDISAKTLVVAVEATNSKTDVATVANGSITKTSTLATFSLTSSMTSAERTLRMTVRDATTLEEYASVLLFVTYDARGD